MILRKTNKNQFERFVLRICQNIVNLIQNQKLGSKETMEMEIDNIGRIVTKEYNAEVLCK